MDWKERWKQRPILKNGQEIFLFLATLFYLTKAEQMPEAQVDLGGEQSWQGKKKNSIPAFSFPRPGLPK